MEIQRSLGSQLARSANTERLHHIEYDGHYYSVLYSYCGKPAILKALPSEIRICDQYNRLICKHKRSYDSFPLYVTDDSHMRPEHLFYKEVNEKDGAYYRRWAVTDFMSCHQPALMSCR